MHRYCCVDFFVFAFKHIGAYYSRGIWFEFLRQLEFTKRATFWSTFVQLAIALCESFWASSIFDVSVAYLDFKSARCDVVFAGSAGSSAMVLRSQEVITILYSSFCLLQKVCYVVHRRYEWFVYLLLLKFFKLFEYPIHDFLRSRSIESGGRGEAYHNDQPYLQLIFTYVIQSIPTYVTLQLYSLSRPSQRPFRASNITTGFISQL